MLFAIAFTVFLLVKLDAEWYWWLILIVTFLGSSQDE